jgi:hypothetical protein
MWPRDYLRHFDAGPDNVVVDLSGDGIPDVFAAQGDIFVGRGDGTFERQSTY